MVFGGVPMHSYYMKTVKLARGIRIFFPTGSSVKHSSSDSGFMGDDGLQTASSTLSYAMDPLGTSLIRPKASPLQGLRIGS